MQISFCDMVIGSGTARDVYKDAAGDPGALARVEP
jgi:hypothetical protein